MRKKAWILLLFATLIALLCACSDTAQQPETEKPKIRIGGTTYAPYFYRNIGGSYTGIDVEIAEEACARIGYEPVFEELDIDKRFELLNEDYVDCLWSCLTMEDREDEFIWAGPYMYTQRVVVVPADSELTFFVDRDRSGYTFEQREDYQRMRPYLMTGQYDILIIKDLSRFSRRNSRGLVELEDLRDAGVRIVAIGDSIDYPTHDD